MKETNVILHGDSFSVIKKLDDNSIDFIITDPPYFIDGMGDDWNENKLTKSAKKAGVIKGLPVGMKFDPKQGIKLEQFIYKHAKEWMRVLKPGGFVVCFSQGRLYHRVGVAIENAGFEIRDMLGWLYEGQAKAFSQDHFIRKNKKLSEEQKENIIKKLNGKKTPQLKPTIEPMVLGQKPREGTFVENYLKYGTGLINTTSQYDNKFPGNTLSIKKPGKKERDENSHFTVKPIELIQYFIKIFTDEGQIVLDPFNGSGSHCVAAKICGRNYIGIEKQKKFVEFSKKRLEGII